MTYVYKPTLMCREGVPLPHINKPQSLAVPKGCILSVEYPPMRDLRPMGYTMTREIARPTYDFR
jgi:hypothetical protein